MSFGWFEILFLDVKDIEDRHGLIWMFRNKIIVELALYGSMVSHIGVQKRFQSKLKVFIDISHNGKLRARAHVDGWTFRKLS